MYVVVSDAAVISLHPQVRGVGVGGIVSTAFSCLYKLFTLRLTRKQVTGLMNHSDSPYLRGLGFMYLRWVSPNTNQLFKSKH